MLNNRFEVLLFKDARTHLAKKENIANFYKLMMTFIDRNSEIFYDSGITVRPLFHPELDKQIIRDIGLDIEKVLEVMHTSSSIKGISRREKSFDNPVYHALLTATHQLYNMNDEEKAIRVNLFLTIRLYSALHRKYLKFEPKREIMDYTIANLSNKFDIRQQGSLYKALEKLAMNNFQTYKDRLLNRNDDESLMLYIENLRTRINSMVQNITDEFMTNWREGNYVNTDSESFKDSEGNEVEVERTSTSAAVVQGAGAFATWFAQNPVDYRLIEVVARQTDTSADTIRHVIEKIRVEDAAALPIIAENLFVLLLAQPNKSMNTVCSAYWVPFVISQFSKSNTENPSILALRSTLSVLLEKYSVKFAGTRREATRMNYRKALLLYFGLVIQKQRCAK